MRGPPTRRAPPMKQRCDERQRPCPPDGKLPAAANKLNNSEQVVLESGTYEPMDLAQLQIFLTVVKEGGSVKAARKLHRVPSNVTTRVKQLEDSVGAELFFRDRKRLFLSPAGRSLLVYAERLLTLSQEA